MSFQQRHVGKRESMGGGTKQKNLIDTASESIDSCQRTFLRRNDMLSGACFHHCYCKPPMSFQQRHVGKRESMGGGSKE